MTREEIKAQYAPLIKDLMNNPWNSEPITENQALDKIEALVKWGEICGE